MIVIENISEILLRRLERRTEATNACRLYHGRGGLESGPVNLSIECYGEDLLWISYDSSGLESCRRAIEKAGNRFAGFKRCYLQDRSKARVETQLQWGEQPEGPTLIKEYGLQYEVRIGPNQNIGFFLASAVVRQWLLQNARDWRILNLFAYTGAFGVASLAAGAEEVIQVDMKAGPLSQAQRNLRINGLAAEASRCWSHDIFKSFGKIGRFGPYDLIICDPPTNQQGAFSVEKDYGRLIRRLSDWLEDGGRAILCLNDPSLGHGYLLDLLEKEAPELRPEQCLLPCEGFAERNPDSACKFLVCVKIGRARAF